MDQLIQGTSLAGRLVNFSEGQIQEDAAGLLEGMSVTTLGLAAFSRQEVPETKRRNFFLYLDEFQNFTTRSMAGMTSELRKYHVGLVLAHQYLFQLEPEVREVVLGNAGTIISIRLGAKDASYLAQEFQPTFSQGGLHPITQPRHLSEADDRGGGE